MVFQFMLDCVSVYLWQRNRCHFFRCGSLPVRLRSAVCAANSVYDKPQMLGRRSEQCAWPGSGWVVWGGRVERGERNVVILRTQSVFLHCHLVQRKNEILFFPILGCIFPWIFTLTICKWCCFLWMSDNPVFLQGLPTQW